MPLHYRKSPWQRLKPLAPLAAFAAFGFAVLAFVQLVLPNQPPGVYYTIMFLIVMLAVLDRFKGKSG